MHLVHENHLKGSAFGEECQSLYTPSEQSSWCLSPVRAGVGEVGRVAAGKAAAGHGVARRRNEHPTVSVTASAPPASGLGAASPSCRCRRRRLPAATTPAPASRHSVLQFVFPSASGNSCKLGINLPWHGKQRLPARNKSFSFKKNMSQQLKRKINGPTLLFKIQTICLLHIQASYDTLVGPPA